MSRAATNAAQAAPLKVSAAEAEAIFEQISLLASTATDLAVDAVEQAGTDPALVAKVYIVQQLVGVIGTLADSAVENTTRGPLGDWLYGKTRRFGGEPER